jgi:flavin-dependent dehydrogenase
MSTAAADYDVAIIGAGLAGMTLALQLRQQDANLSIAVIERNALPPPLAAHKVGESTVEIGAHYLSETLGLADMLEGSHLRKFGLRLFFGAGHSADLADADELGASRLLPAISYQIDRGRLEGDVARLLIGRGVDVIDNCRASITSISDNGANHQLRLKSTETGTGTERDVRARWLIDAGARRASIKRKLNINAPSEHRICSAWFRIDDSIVVDDWSVNQGWQQRCNRPRWYSTNHLMGAGYWVWIIPLAGGRTSIGLVADPAIHPPGDYDTYDKLRAWLELHQPRLADALAGVSGEPMDFRALRNLARDARQVWSRDRWATTGEAGIFTDPFYSPGSDFIGIGNTFISDLVRRDFADDQFRQHVAVYQQMYLSFSASTLSLYENLYAGFGDTRLMVAKTTWDYAYYWSVLTWLFVRGVMTDIAFLGSIQPRLVELRDLNGRMQGIFRERAAQMIVDEGRGRFFDQAAIPILYNLNAALLDQVSDLTGEFYANASRLDAVAPELLSLLRDDAPAGMSRLLGDLSQRF